MQVVSRPELDLEVLVDHDADAVDVDAAVARFLLAFVRKRKQSQLQPGTPAVAGGFSQGPERKGMSHE